MNESINQLTSSDVSLVRNDNIVTDDQKLTEIVNHHYLNIVEKSSDKKPISLAKGTSTLKIL